MDLPRGLPAIGAALRSAPFLALLAVLPAPGFPPAVGAAPVARPSRTQPMERYEDPPGVPATVVRGARVASSITFNGYTSIQVNVNANQQDIVGDAANEPSIVVDPHDHDRMVIGWRQFDTVGSNFRQAGFGFTSNGGATWTTGKINAGVFRSDPVLDADSSGHFVYNSLRQTLNSDIFESSNGITWGAPVAAFGGDKQWMKIDRGLNNFYQAWSTSGNNYAPNTFNRSIDDGVTFGAPDSIPSSPIWGTLDVALDHSLYLVGVGDGVVCNTCVERSTDAQNHVLTAPTFAYHDIDLGGEIATGGPNPVGLLGQLWIAVDRSNTSRSGWVYVLASVTTPTDPLDIHFIRSTDNGRTWSAPVRVNDDPIGNRAFQWFGTMSVSPSGRIDAIWNDTRGSSDSTISALFYSFSVDGGAHWSSNVQVTPTWSSTMGWPNQQKIGDYYTMVSDNTGADVAYAATFNGGQDVYYLRIPNAAALAVEGAPVVETRLTNAPNPFTQSTRIRFDATAAGEWMRVEVLDIAGRHVATLLDRFVIGAGQSVVWDGRRDGGAPTPAGVYLCRLEAAGRTETHKLLRLE